MNLSATRRKSTPALRDNAAEQLPPHDPVAEAGALACVLCADAAEAAAMLDRLAREDFYDARHQTIFAALRCLAKDGKLLDVVSLSQWLRDKRRMDGAGGLEYVSALPDKTPSAANFSTYLETIQDRTVDRALLRDAGELVLLSRDPSVSRAVKADATRKMLEAYSSAARNGAPGVALTLGELRHEDAGGGSELIQCRYLCRTGALLLCGPTGIGKSSLLMQLLLCWAIGREIFGMRPSRPLTSLLIQAENDDGDLAEMRDGILRGMGFTEAQRAQALAAVRVFREDSHTGLDFCRTIARPLLMAHKPDLFAIDPALAYIGGQSKEQGDVTPFLRNGLNPLLREFNCGGIVAHHTNKPPSGREKPNWQAGDFAYLGAGSAEWANWPRAILTLRNIGSQSVFELQAPKRGKRLGWQDSAGGALFKRHIAHEPGCICWREAQEAEIITGRPKSYDPAEFLELLPDAGLATEEWKKLAKRECGISEATFHRERRALEKAGRILKSKVSGNWARIEKA